MGTHKETASAISALETSPTGATMAKLLRREIDGGLGKECPDAAAELAGRCQVVMAIVADDGLRSLLAKDHDDRGMRIRFMAIARRVRAGRRLETRFQSFAWDRILRG